MQTYKGYIIEQGFFGVPGYTVVYCGDIVVFKTIEEAKEFIDSIK